MEKFIRDAKTIRKSQRKIVGINSNPDEEFLHRTISQTDITEERISEP